MWENLEKAKWYIALDPIVDGSGARTLYAFATRLVTSRCQVQLLFRDGGDQLDDALPRKLILAATWLQIAARQEFLVERLSPVARANGHSFRDKVCFFEDSPRERKKIVNQRKGLVRMNACHISSM